jgi:hypothetical protein
LIAQLPLEAEHLASLAVRVADRTSGLERITRAVSRLGVSIGLLECNAIHEAGEQQIEMIVNLAAVQKISPYETTPANTVQHYEVFRGIFVLEDPTHVQLFETLILECADILAWVESQQGVLPAISIRPLRSRRFHGTAFPVTVSVEGGALRVPLPSALAARIRSRGYDNQEVPTSYLFVSDSYERSVRVVFFEAKVLPRLAYVAFHYDDVPDALATLEWLVGNAGFRVITGRARPTSPTRGVWETIMEYRGTDSIPELTEGGPRTFQLRELGWLAQLLVESVPDGEVPGVDCAIAIGRPYLPRPRGAEGSAGTDTPLVELGQGLRFKSRDLASGRDEQLARRHAAVSSVRPRLQQGVLLALEKVGNRIARERRPRIFLSYPTPASRHAEYLRKALSESFEVHDYMRPGGDLIVEEIRRGILECDYFVALWHHEEPPSQDGSYSLSPWMFFEYGIASSVRMPCFIAYSERLRESVWRRIDAGSAFTQYSDVGFVSETMPNIVAAAERNWATRAL